jgi:homoaconitase/3-isopropylmalate dehydratase large subunit
MTPRRKMPTKAELLQLQKLYKTDEKIGERLGGVPAYLVAYWRRKKHIPKYSLPKFSEIEIRNLWERYGDDEKAGLELGISKAAFYNWRRRYGIREKPAFLKLEQLELNFPGSKYNARADSLYGKRTLAQKALALAAGLDRAEPGQVVEVEPHAVLLYRGAGEVISAFRKSGPEYVWNPNKICISQSFGPGLDEAAVAEHHRLVREFVRRQGIRSFCDVRDGGGTQVVVERGWILPGQLVLGTDPQVLSCGSLGSMAVEVTPEQMAALWAEGKMAMTTPATVRINVTGRKARGIYAKDIVISVIRQLGPRAAAGRVIEYGGSVVSQMSISERYTLANTAVDMGAVAAVCPYDATVRRYLTGRTMTNYRPLLADRDAEYDEIYQVSIEQLTPQVVCPGEAGPVKSAAELEGTAIRQVVIGTGASGRFDDLRVAADILKGKTVHEDCRLYIYPGSRAVYLEALKKGLIRVFVEAGGMVMNPGGRPFSAVRNGGLAEGEKGLATTTRYMSEEVDKKAAGQYLCSPATAAASALNGVITDPTRYVR